MKTAAKVPTPAGLLDSYERGEHFCELEGLGELAHTRDIRQRLNALDLAGLRRRARDAGRELLNLGITFTVYSEREAIDRVLPFDVIPRVLSKDDWRIIETGVTQRVQALNLFLHDIYHDQHILKDGTVPAELITGNKQYVEAMRGVDVAHGTYVHICGTDLVRDETGAFRVLEDNCRAPSGVSYVIENRHLMMRAFPDLADGIRIADVDEYGARLRGALNEVAPQGVSHPQVALLPTTTTLRSRRICG
ncbi:MAG: hypothetical protein HKN60_00085 [Rhizobiales bacterium]|nr:hypothetical protein [Hyphomicrobiales bacterium]